MSIDSLLQVRIHKHELIKHRRLLVKFKVLVYEDSGTDEEAPQCSMI